MEFLHNCQTFFFIFFIQLPNNPKPSQKFEFHFQKSYQINEELNVLKNHSLYNITLRVTLF